MLLQRIVISNFLSIRGSIEIDMDPKVTILLGSNDHGKTNILRALQHLNADTPISQDEANWDGYNEGEEPSLSFDLRFGDEERRAWREIVEELQKTNGRAETEVTTASSSEEEPAAEEPSTEKIAPRKPIAEKETTEKASMPVQLDPTADFLTLVRRGVDKGLEMNGTLLQDLPDAAFEFIEEQKPRVELFKAPSIGGNLQDSVTAEQITAPDFEFMQGILYYAGLNPLNSTPLFTQSDTTTRRLDVASKRLDESLRSLWAQGRSEETLLRFDLRHQGDTIQLYADDPAVKSRRARMSTRSDGVTQFFRVSMVLHARRQKNPANSYIYLFDEPGVYLHPLGQKDLMQVFERLVEESQIIYATHSLFMLNQNFPERHRLIFKDQEGSKVDQKPYLHNWKRAVDALGVYFTSNVMFASKVVLVEGDSDPIYIQELFRQLNRFAHIDADANMLGVMSFNTLPNLRYLMQILKHETRDAEILLLLDGDDEGKRLRDHVTALAERLKISNRLLPENRSIEDYCLSRSTFVDAVVQTLVDAHKAESKSVPGDLENLVQASWDGHLKDQKITTGRWFKSLSRQFLGDEASKVALSRNYALLSRDMKTAEFDLHVLTIAISLCREIIQTLKLPPTRATKALETGR